MPSEKVIYVFDTKDRFTQHWHTRFPIAKETHIISYGRTPTEGELLESFGTDGGELWKCLSMIVGLRHFNLSKYQLSVYRPTGFNWRELDPQIERWIDHTFGDVRIVYKMNLWHAIRLALDFFAELAEKAPRFGPFVLWNIKSFVSDRKWDLEKAIARARNSVEELATKVRK